MRIALLTEKYPPDAGGLAISVQRLARLLVTAGHQAHVITLTTQLAPGQTTCTEQDNIVVHRLGARPRTDDALADWFSYLNVQHHRLPFDILHAYFITQAGFLAAYAGRVLGVPSVISARGNDLDRALFDPGKAAHVLYALNHADAVTANSRDLVRKARALSSDRDVTLVPNGIDCDLFKPLPRDDELARSLGLGDEPIIGFVGEARAKKGLAPLLVAYRAVAQTRPAALLLVGGVRRDDKETFRVFQKQNPDLPLVVVPGVLNDDLPAYYNLLDVLVMPSLRDGLPNALLEGMACECAVVASNVGGMPDAIQDGYNGKLISPGDTHALASALCEVLDDPDLRRRWGHNARLTVERDFTLEQELQLDLQVYQRVKAIHVKRQRGTS